MKKSTMSMLQKDTLSVEKLQSLSSLLQKIMSGKRVAHALLPILCEIKDLITIRNVTIFLFDHSLCDI
jgi:hypothetical protein